MFIRLRLILPSEITRSAGQDRVANRVDLVSWRILCRSGPLALHRAVSHLALATRASGPPPHRIFLIECEISRSDGLSSRRFHKHDGWEAVVPWLFTLSLPQLIFRRIYFALRLLAKKNAAQLFPLIISRDEFFLCIGAVKVDAS